MFCEKFKQLRIEKNMSQDSIASTLDVSPALISKWENDLSTPNPEMLGYIADFFHVTTDFLLGRDDKITIEDSENEKSQNDKLIDLMQKAEKNYNLKMIFDKTSDLDDKALQKLDKLIDIIKDDNVD